MSEKWFLLENYSSRKEALVAARVPVSEVRIAEPRAITGLAFPEENKGQVLALLGLEDLRFVETPTNQSGVFLLEIQSAEVRISAPNGYKCDHWKNLARRVSDWAKKTITEISPVIVYVSSSPEGEGLHIVLNSAISGGVNKDEKITYLPGGGQIGFTGLNRCPSNSDFNFVKRSVSELLPELLATGEEAERLRAEAREREFRASREAYVRECGRRLESTISATRRSIEEAEWTIRDAQKRITEAVRAESGFRKKLQQLLESSDEAKAGFAEEFKKLCAVPGVERVRVADGVVQVFTEQVDISYDGRTYDIGKFRLDIYTSGSNGGVRAFNLTRTVEGCHHPHVKDGGKCCLGNISDGVAKLIGEYQYSVLAQIMLQYLRTVNPSDWFYSVTNWPLAAKREV